MKLNITVDLDWLEEDGNIDEEVKHQIIQGVKSAISKQCLDKVEKKASDNVKDECCNSFLGGKLLSLFGDDAWYNDWPSIPNPQYLRMESRLNAVREALKQINVS